MSESLNNKELVAVGHEFAKALSSDTPIIDIAKMMSRLAERLDCTTAALRETAKQRDAHHEAEKIWEKTMMEACGEDGPASVAGEIKALREKRDLALASVREQRDQLAADNVARAEIIGQLVWQYSASGIKPVQKSLNPASALLYDALEVLRQPATEAAVNELKAQAKPEGWRLVPLEPTPEMLAEMCLVEGWTERALKARYQAMLAAAPGKEV